MRLKSFRSLTHDLDPNAHILVSVLGRSMHLRNGLGTEMHNSLRLPYIIIDLDSEYTFKEDIERSRY